MSEHILAWAWQRFRTTVMEVKGELTEEEAESARLIFYAGAFVVLNLMQVDTTKDPLEGAKKLFQTFSQLNEEMNQHHRDVHARLMQEGNA